MPMMKGMSNMNKKEKINNIIELEKAINEKDKDMLVVFNLALSDDNVENICHQLDVHYDDFMKLDKYVNCNNKLSEISDQIENLENGEIKTLFAEYQENLRKIYEYDACLANVLGLRYGLAIGLLKENPLT